MEEAINRVSNLSFIKHHQLGEAAATDPAAVKDVAGGVVVASYKV